MKYRVRNILLALYDGRFCSITLPYKGLTEVGKLNITRRMDTPRFREHRDGLQLKYRLPKLRLKDLRHWVATRCRKAGLSNPATNYMQGHDADASSIMGDFYDNPPLEEWLQEQKDMLPNGLFGTLVPIEVELIADIPPEGVSLLKDFSTGRQAPLPWCKPWKV